MTDKAKSTPTVGASADELRRLHGAVARSYLRLIESYENNEHLNVDGKPKPLPASILQGAAQFLKSNSVDRAERPPDEDDPLNDEMPDLSHLDFDGTETSGE